MEGTEGQYGVLYRFTSCQGEHETKTHRCSLCRATVLLDIALCLPRPSRLSPVHVRPAFLTNHESGSILPCSEPPNDTQSPHWALKVQL
jgi:hypothetical protein